MSQYSFKQMTSVEKKTQNKTNYLLGFPFLSSFCGITTSRRIYSGNSLCLVRDNTIRKPETTVAATLESLIFKDRFHF